MDKIKILYVNGGIMNRGGIESYMMNYYRNINKDNIQIDFIVHGFEKGAYDDEIISMGGKIYNIPIKSKDYIGNIKALRKIFLSGEYKIVHSHMDAMSTVVLKVAKECGIPIRIAHSHNTKHLTNNKLKLLLNEFARKRIKKYATNFFACSELAGRWLFGDNAFDNGKVKIIKNAIDVDRFYFNTELREELRDNLELRDKFVVGHVGRFDYQKNHVFLLNMFKDLVKRRKDVILLLIGDGHLKDSIINEIKILGIEENVRLLGVCSNVNEILNIFDVFILPSLFEGLPVVGIESQINGLTCLFSDKISKEVDITGKNKFLSIDKKYDNWVNELLDIKGENLDRYIDEDLVIKSGYDIKKEVKNLENIYLKLINSTDKY